MIRPILLATLLLTLLGSCRSSSKDSSSSLDAGSPDVLVQTWSALVPDLELSSPPFEEVHANWKQRIDQPYVYVEYTGSYVETGRLLPLVHRAMLDQGFEPSGPPFALYYDDPGRVPAEELRSRACVPVNQVVSPSSNLLYDLLPSTTVVYAFASGPYPDVPRAYPGIYGFMNSMGWVENGPIRETYLVSPGSVASYDELLTEVQIPVSFGR